MAADPAQLLNIVIHEAGHGFTVKAFGREAPTAGIGWYWFGPIAFIDTTDMWLTARWPRIAVSLAGSYANLVTGGIAAVAAWLSTDPGLVGFLWEFALLSYIGVLINLNPLMEFDGYYVLADLLNRPNLRARALAWIGGVLRGTTPTRQALKGHRIELVFGVASIFYVLAIAALTILFFRLVLEDWIGAVLPELGSISVPSTRSTQASMRSTRASTAWQVMRAAMAPQTAAAETAAAAELEPNGLAFWRPLPKP